MLKDRIILSIVVAVLAANVGIGLGTFLNKMSQKADLAELDELRRQVANHDKNEASLLAHKIWEHEINPDDLPDTMRLTSVPGEREYDLAAVIEPVDADGNPTGEWTVGFDYFDKDRFLVDYESVTRELQQLGVLDLAGRWARLRRVGANWGCSEIDQ